MLNTFRPFLTLAVMSSACVCDLDAAIAAELSPSDRAIQTTPHSGPSGEAVELEQTFTPIMELDGVVEPLQYLDIPARREGLLESLDIRAGDVVVAQAVFGTLNEDQERSNLKKAEAELKFAIMNAENHFISEAIEQERYGKEKRLKRVQVLLQDSQLRDFVPPTSAEVDDLASAIKKLELDMEAEKHKLAAAREEANAKVAEVAIAAEEIERSKILSLVSGVVTQIHRYPGDWIERGGKVATVVRMDRLQVKVRVPAKFAASTSEPPSATDQLSPAQLLGQSVDLKFTSVIDQSEIIIAGKVKRVVPELLGGRTIDAYVEFDNELVLNQNGEKVWKIWLTQPATVRVYASNVAEAR